MFKFRNSVYLLAQTMRGNIYKIAIKVFKGSNSAFVDGAGELVCFDGSELIGMIQVSISGTTSSLSF